MLHHRRFTLRLAGLAAALLGLAGTALAQGPACQQYRAELASLGRGGSAQAAAAAQRQQAEIARMSAYYRSIGCDRGGFLFFGSSAPPECGSIAQRIQAMQSNLQRLSAQADPYSGQVEARRRQLMAAIEQACNPQRDAALGQPRGFFEQLFGVRPQGEPPRDGMPPDMLQDGEPRARLGGRKLVCVRTCDGSFFPLSNAPEGREGPDAMCQALCPGAETAAYYTSAEGPIENALSVQGRPYAQLANAARFRKSFDPACSCRREGQSWSQALARAEELLGSRRGDLIVTAAKAEELSRPRTDIGLRGSARDARERRDREAKAQASSQSASQPSAGAPAQASAPAAGGRAEGESEESRVEAQRAAAAPTAGTESSGIAAGFEEARVVGGGDGPRREVTTDTGARRTVRVVAPTVIPVPNGTAR